MLLFCSPNNCTSIYSFADRISNNMVCVIALKIWFFCRRQTRFTQSCMFSRSFKCPLGLHTHTQTTKEVMYHSQKPKFPFKTYSSGAMSRIYVDYVQFVVLCVCVLSSPYVRINIMVCIQLNSIL